MKELCTECIDLKLIVSGLERIEGEKMKIFQVRKELGVKQDLLPRGVEQDLFPRGGVKQDLLGGGVKQDLLDL